MRLQESVLRSETPATPNSCKLRLDKARAEAGPLKAQIGKPFAKDEEYQTRKSVLTA